LLALCGAWVWAKSTDPRCCFSHCQPAKQFVVGVRRTCFVVTEAVCIIHLKFAVHVSGVVLMFSSHSDACTSTLGCPHCMGSISAPVVPPILMVLAQYLAQHSACRRTYNNHLHGCMRRGPSHRRVWLVLVRWLQSEGSQMPRAVLLDSKPRSWCCVLVWALPNKATHRVPHLV
jgi:hypothetical protein